MVELQVLNKVLNEGSMAIVLQNEITTDHFIEYRDEFEFVWNHYQTYGNVPDKETVISKFNEFTFMDVAESAKYLVETLQEQYVYSLMVHFVNGIAERAKTNSNDAVAFAQAEIERIKAAGVGYRSGTNIVRSAGDRVREVQFRMNAKGLLGISTGIPELDNITHGWMGEDLIIIVGRTNEGKSWVLDYFLVSAFKQKKRVLLYSGEMSGTIVGFRFDTLLKNFNNEALMHGLENLGTSDHPVSLEDYAAYAKELEANDGEFIVITPKDLGGSRLTVPMLHRLIEQYKPDIVGIDQLSLMDDYRSKPGTPERLMYTHISQDLYITSEKYSIPIIAPAQASREAEKEDDETAPRLHQISESDGVGQNATRVISIKRIDVTYKFDLVKNRFGKNNEQVMVMWDINMGVVKPFLTVSAEGRPRLSEKAAKEGAELF